MEDFEDRKLNLPSVLKGKGVIREANKIRRLTR